MVYENQRDAEEAISRMDNAELDGRTLRVNFARPKYVGGWMFGCVCV